VHCPAQRLRGTWPGCATVALTTEGGDIATGAIYAGQAQLPNATLRYRFRFTAGDGRRGGRRPQHLAAGPLIAGVPHLCWTGSAGLEADGVNPDSGPTGMRFYFSVRYTDSAGDAPTITSSS